MFQFVTDVLSLRYFKSANNNRGDNEPNTGTSTSNAAPLYKEKYPSGNPPTRLKSYNKETWEKIEEYAAKVRELVREWAPYREIQEVLEESPDVSETVNLRDHNGYNLLQYAVIANRPTIVQYLVRQGSEVNLPTCGRPLHLAAKLGLTEIVSILLEYNADPDVVSTVCHPQQHIDSKIVYTGDTGWCTACVNDVYYPEGDYVWLFEYPLYYAISSDSVECVRLCLQRGITQLITKASPLHVACFLGSFHCAQLFLEQNPGDLHVPDMKGDLPIQAAVRWGQHFVEDLVLKGASVMVNNSRGETLLHILYSEADSTTGLAETTAYLLHCGLSMKINVVDEVGNSALHTLLRRLQQSPPKCLSKSMVTFMEGRHDNNTNTEDSAEDKAVEEGHEMHATASQSCESDCLALLSNMNIQDEVREDPHFTPDELEYIHSIELLLNSGANPNISNTKTGDTSLHMLARVASKPQSDPNLPRVFCSFKLVHRLLELLLQRGANQRLMNNVQSSVLGLFVVNGCGALFSQKPGLGKFELPDPEEVRQFLRCLRLLWQHGGDFGAVAGYLGQECLLHTVLEHLDKLEQLQQGGLGAEQQRSLGQTYVEHVLAVLQCLLQCGCRPDACKYPQSDLHTLYYKLSARHSLLPPRLLHTAVLLLLHHGADPNSRAKHIPMSVFRRRSNHAHWPVYPLLHLINIIGSREVKDREEDLFSLMHIFYNSMEENNARQCLFHYLEYDRFRGRTSKYPELDNYLLNMLNNPRSLKQICASYIFSEMAQRHVKKLDKIPLPVTMKKIILSFQY